MWLHESFANTPRALHECGLGKERRRAYMIGARRGVRNDRPIRARVLV